MAESADDNAASGDPESKRCRTQRWVSTIIADGEKYPLDEWKRSRDAYAGSPEKGERKRANLHRGQLDTTEAYLSQTDAEPRVAPRQGREDDEMAVGRAKCDAALARYFRDELALRLKAERCLHHACLYNAGCVVRRWDPGRGVPTVRPIPASSVRWDSDCGGRTGEAGWMAWCEWISPYILARDYEGIPLEAFVAAAGKALSAETDQIEEETRRETREKAGAVMAKCRVWHYFGRNEFALFDENPDEVGEGERKGKPQWERFRDQHGMREPRRYVRLVEGLEGYGPLEDQYDWPEHLAIDAGEWPVIWLAFNDDDRTVAGYADYRHTSRVNEMYDDGLGDVAKRLGLSLALKFLLGKGSGQTAAEIKGFLDSDEIEVLEGLVDAQTGKALIQALKLADFPAELPAVLELLRKVADLESQQNEIMRGGEGQFESAREAAISEAGSSIRIAKRLIAYEGFLAEIYRALLAMAHVRMPQLTLLEVPIYEGGRDGDDGEIEITGYEELNEGEGGAPLYLPWAEAERLMAEMPGTEVIELGVEALVGPELAQFWDEEMPLEVVRRDLVVTVEHGSTQKTARLERGAILKEVATGLLMPLCEQAGRPDLLLEIVKRILASADLGQLDGLLPTAEDFQRAAQAQAAEAQEPAPETEAETPTEAEAG